MKILILGGGLSGLAAAYKLSNSNEVLILEKEDYLGGQASSNEIFWDGKIYPISKTYHHILQGDNTTIQFIKEFNLSKKFHQKKVSTGFLFKNKVYGFTTPLEILKFPTSLWDKFLLAKFVLIGTKRKDWESIKEMNAKEWIIKEAGETNFNVFFDQLIRNKFHKGAEEISAPWIGTRFSKESSSFMKSFGWLEGGLKLFVDGFVDAIKRNNGIILTNAKVTSLDMKNKKVSYTINNKKQTYQADIIISTIPPEELIKVSKNLNKEFIEDTKNIKYLSCICMTLGLKSKLSPYYWINILDKGMPFSALFVHSNLYEDSAPKDKSVMFVVTYLDKDEPLWKMSDEAIFETYISSLSKVFPSIRNEIEWHKITKLKYAEAIYSLDFKNPNVQYGNLYLAGIYRIFPKIRNMASAIESGLEVANIVEANKHV